MDTTTVTVTSESILTAANAAWSVALEAESLAGKFASAQVRLWGTVRGGLAEEYAWVAAAASYEARSLSRESEELRRAEAR